MVRRDRVIAEGEALVVRRREGLCGVPACDENCVSFEQRRVHNEKLQLEDVLDIAVKFLNAFDHAFLVVRIGADAQVFAEEGTVLAV